jgi:hypothetical protein
MQHGQTVSLKRKGSYNCKIQTNLFHNNKMMIRLWLEMPGRGGFSGPSRPVKVGTHPLPSRSLNQPHPSAIQGSRQVTATLLPKSSHHRVTRNTANPLLRSHHRKRKGGVPRLSNNISVIQQGNDRDLSCFSGVSWSWWWPESPSDIHPFPSKLCFTPLFCPGWYLLSPAYYWFLPWIVLKNSITKRLCLPARLVAAPTSILAMMFLRNPMFCPILKLPRSLKHANGKTLAAFDL